MIAPNLVVLPVVHLRRHVEAKGVILAVVCGGAAYEFLAASNMWRGWESTKGLESEPYWQNDWEVKSPMGEIFVCAQQGGDGATTYFAFPNLVARDMALKMAKAEGFGIKKAINVFQKVPLDTLVAIVEAGDREAFCKLPTLTGKLGPKVAEVLFAGIKPGKAKVAAVADPDTVSALMAMQLKKQEAENWALKAMAALPDGTTTDWVPWALKARMQKPA